MRFAAHRDSNVFVNPRTSDRVHDTPSASHLQPLSNIPPAACPHRRRPPKTRVKGAASAEKLMR